MPTELFDLPREIRGLIWGYVINSDDIVKIKFHRNKDGTRSHYLTLPWSGMIAADRTSYEEISHQLRGKTRFPLVERISFFPNGDRPLYRMIHQLASSPCCKKWLKTLKAEWRAYIDRPPHPSDADYLDRRYKYFDDEVTKALGYPEPANCITIGEQKLWKTGPYPRSVAQVLILQFEID